MKKIFLLFSLLAGTLHLAADQIGFEVFSKKGPHGKHYYNLKVDMLWNDIIEEIIEDHNFKQGEAFFGSLQIDPQQRITQEDLREYKNAGTLHFRLLGNELPRVK